jgi:riboflavin biosynthesis pyrimidine reductase
VRSVLCEGGPELNRGLLEAGLVDELFLTLVPVVTADPGAPAIVSGGHLQAPARMDLVRVLEHDGHLFLRYRMRRS